MTEEQLRIEVVFAGETRQELLEMTVPAGSTVSQAISESRICGMFPDEPLGSMDVGVWGRLVNSANKLRDGDRIEFYRPLKMDPREARRLLAEGGRTMSQGLDTSDGSQAKQS